MFFAWLLLRAWASESWRHDSRRLNVFPVCTFVLLYFSKAPPLSVAPCYFLSVFVFDVSAQHQNGIEHIKVLVILHKLGIFLFHSHTCLHRLLANIADPLSCCASSTVFHSLTLGFVFFLSSCQHLPLPVTFTSYTFSISNVSESIPWGNHRPELNFAIISAPPAFHYNPGSDNGLCVPSLLCIITESTSKHICTCWLSSYTHMYVAP